MMQQMAATGVRQRMAHASASGSSGHQREQAPRLNALQMQQKSLEFVAQHQQRQREALARVLTPEQLKIVEDEHNAELQMQRAQLRMMRAQQEAGLLDPAQGNNVGFVQDSAVFMPSVSD